MSIVFDLMKQFNDAHSLKTLLELLSFDSYTDSEYKSIMYFLIENTLLVKEVIAQHEMSKSKLITFSKSNINYPPVIEYFNNLFFKPEKSNGNAKANGDENSKSDENVKQKEHCAVNNESKASFYIIKEKKLINHLEEINVCHYSNNQPHSINITRDIIDSIYNIILSQFNHNENQREYLLNQTIKLYYCFSKNQRHSLSKLFYSYLQSLNKLLIYECFFDLKEITEDIYSLSSNGINYYDYVHYASFHSHTLFARKIYFILLYIHYYNCYLLDEKTVLKIIICFEFTEVMFNDKCPLSLRENKVVINNKNIEETKYSSIFPISIVNDYKCVMNMVSHFYHLPLNKVVMLNSEFNFNFLIGISDLYHFNKTHITLQLFQYRNSLIAIEKEIINIYLIETKNKNLSKDRDTDFNNDSSIIIEEIELDQHLKNIYCKLTAKIREKMNHMCAICNSKIYFIPFGSVTQLLSGNNADLDIYFKLTTRNLKDQSDILSELVLVIKSLDKRTEIIVPPLSRLCLIKFSYENTKVDLNYFGICSVIGGSLLREYSLYDVRFPILAITIKHILKKYNISHSSKECYLNSFSWMLLLLTFLQDIIKPPVLPKILNKYIKRIMKLPVKGFCSIITQVPLNLEYQPFALVSSVNQFKATNVNMMKNSMSCSELLLKFLEFIGFYWNYETIYVNTRFDNQSYLNKKDIKKLHNDALFVKYFNQIFMRKQAMTETLICEPFDHRYNPAKNAKQSMKELLNKIKELYSRIVETGHL